MAKKIVKNILLLFVIIYTILNLAMYVYIVIDTRSFTLEMADRVRKSDYEGLLTDEEISKSIKDIYGKEAQAMVIQSAQSYIIGATGVLEKGAVTIIISAALSIAIGIITSLTEKSKIKEILYFFLIGIILNLIYIAYFSLTRNLPDTNFLEGFIDQFIWNIEDYGIYYIIIYIIIFIIRYFINKRNASKLNDELKLKSNLK